MNITQQFADIVEIFASDGYTFLKIRTELEDLQKQASYGDEDAEKILDIVTKFHKLCKVLEAR